MRVAFGGAPLLQATPLTDRLLVTAQVPVDLYYLGADDSLQVQSVEIAGNGVVPLPGLAPGFSVDLQHELGPLSFRQGAGLLVWASLAVAVLATCKESRWLEGAEYLLERVVGRGSLKILLRNEHFS